MMSLFKNKMVLLGVGGVLLAGFVWYSFLRDKETQLLKTEDITAPTAVDSDIVTVLLQLRAVSLSGTIFTDPAFLTLKDFGSQIMQEPNGRANPFAPLGSTATTSTTAGPLKKAPAR